MCSDRLLGEVDEVNVSRVGRRKGTRGTKHGPISALLVVKAAQKGGSSRPQGCEDLEAYSVLYVEGFERLRTKLGGYFKKEFGIMTIDVLEPVALLEAMEGSAVRLTG